MKITNEYGTFEIPDYDLPKFELDIEALFTRTPNIPSNDISQISRTTIILPSSADKIYDPPPDFELTSKHAVIIHIIFKKTTPTYTEYLDHKDVWLLFEYKGLLSDFIKILTNDSYIQSSYIYKYLGDGIWTLQYIHS